MARNASLNHMLSPSIKNDFPIFASQQQKGPFVYLDSAATAQMPRPVLAAMIRFEAESRANVHRGMYAIAEEATAVFEGARARIAQWIGAAPEEIIFTKNASEALNLVARGIASRLAPGKEIAISILNHHSNIVPWQDAARRASCSLRYLEARADGDFDPKSINDSIHSSTKIVAIVSASNAMGTLAPIEDIILRARACGALTVVDAAQWVPHFPVNVKALQCDFLAFSGHKMFGPTGIGVLYGKKQLLEEMEPFLFGGDMIREVERDRASWNDVPWKFEAGTPPIAQAIGLGEAIAYIEHIGFPAIEAHEAELTAIAQTRLSLIRGLRMFGPPQGARRASVISFTVEGIHPHDMATVLARDGICVRAGHHCAMPLMTTLGIGGTTRASFSIYNTADDVEALARSIEKTQKMFGF